jgi:hypothetical protein
MPKTRELLTRILGMLYLVTALACIFLACTDLTDNYREMARLMAPLGPGRFWYLWYDLVGFGVLLIAPAAALLFSGIGVLTTLANRIRVFFISIAVTLPFIVATCLPHVHGFRATLYVGGPVASILASLTYRRVSYEKCAFWSSAVLLASRLFTIYSQMGHVYVYSSIVGSYMLWGEIQFTCAGLVLFCLGAAAVRLARVWRVARNSRKTFAA